MTPVELGLLAIAAPAGVALLAAIVPPLRRAGRPLAALSVIAAAVALASALGMLAATASPSEGFEGAAGLVLAMQWLPLDGAEVGVLATPVSVLMLVIVTSIALLVQVYSLAYLHDEPRPAFGRYYACQSLFLVAMEILVLAPNLLQMFIGWELVGVSSFLLIGFWYRKPSAARAALKAFWITKLADSGFIVALIVLHRVTGSFDVEATRISGAAATAVALLLLLAIAGKSAQFPLHVWLPDAMEGPTPVSALLHAATMVAAGVYLVVAAWPLFEASPTALVVMAHVGAFTAVFAGCVAVVQDDIKRVLAYSTCSQLGFMFAGLGAGSQLGGFFHLTTHAAFKAMLFLAAGSVIHAVHSNDLRDMGGLARRMRFTAAAFIVGALALAGLPGLSGFFSKDVILEAAAERGMPVVVALLVIAAGLTAFYMARVVLLAFFGPPHEQAAHAHEPPAAMLVPVLLLMVPTIALGYLAGPFASSLGEGYHFHLGAAGIAALVAAAAGFALAFVLARRREAPAGLAVLGRVARSGAVDRLHLLAYRRGLRGMGGVAAWIDRYIVDGVMNLAGWAFVAGGRRLRAVQTGDAGDYAWAVFAATMLLVAWGVLR